MKIERLIIIIAIIFSSIAAFTRDYNIKQAASYRSTTDQPWPITGAGTIANQSATYILMPASLPYSCAFEQIGCTYTLVDGTYKFEYLGSNSLN